MWLKDILFGSLTKIIPSLKEFAEVFVGNKKERDSNDSDEQIAVHNEHAAGYTYKANNRNWFDRAIDGLNRLPRPLITLMICAMFIWAAVEPVRFAVSMRALDTVPRSMWEIVAMVLAFWFGSRLLARDIASQGATVKGAAEARKDLEKLAVLPPTSDGGTGNSVIEKWRASR